MFHESCFSCDKLTHLTSECPIISPFFQKRSIFYKTNFSQPQKRMGNFNRKNLKSTFFHIPNSKFLETENFSSNNDIQEEEETMDISPNKLSIERKSTEKEKEKRLSASIFKNFQEEGSDHFEIKHDFIKSKTNKTLKTLKTTKKFDFTDQNFKMASQSIQSSAMSKISKYQQWKSKNNESIKSFVNSSKTISETMKEKTFETMKSKKEKEIENKFKDNEAHMEEEVISNQIVSSLKIFEEETKIENDEIFTHFDKCSSFKNYFPLNNYQEVLKKMNRQINWKKLKRGAPVKITHLSKLSKLKNKIKSVKQEQLRKNTMRKKVGFSETSISNSLRPSEFGK